MSIYRTRSMQPRNGHTLVVLMVARISGCPSQKDVSLDDQQEHIQESIEEIYEGAVEYRVISTKGKGELLTRPELVEVDSEIRSREIDVFIKEDIGRLVRGIEASRLYGIAVDHGTRAIAINDCIDTWEEGWEEDVIAACRDHVSHNIHTSKRIKKKLMLRFKRKGAATPCPIAGYVKPEGAENFHDWHVDQAVKPIILDGAKLLRQHLNCSALADYFNTVKLPVGPFCRNDEWDGAMVRRYFGNAILKGKPERGNMHTVKHHETGKRRSVKNPEGPVSIDLPHLAILSDDDFDELNALLTEKNSRMGRKPYGNGQDPLAGIPRKRTRFPGQHARCWYCGRILVWGGNGIADHLQCTGSRQYKCWNSIGIHGGRITKLIVDAVWSLLDRISGFDSDLFEQTSNIVESPAASLEASVNRLKCEEAELAKQEQNLLDTISAYGPSETVEKGLKSLAEKKMKLQIEKSKIKRQSISSTDLPTSTGELRSLVKSKFLDLAMDSYAFGQLFPQIVPEIYVYCVRLCNGGPLLPRVKFKVDLSGSFEGHLCEEIRQQLVADFTADVFVRPEAEVIRQNAVELSREGKSKKFIGQSIDGTPSLRMINKALDLQQVMDNQQLIDPYVLQLSPPEDLSKLKRHRHPRFEFKTLEGYKRSEL